MEDKSEVVLGWYRYPLPNGTNYTSSDLINEGKVEELFDYCQILLGYIYDIGWKFLFENHGVDNLIKIAVKSAWVSDNKNDYHEDIFWLIHYCLTAGYDPVSGRIGDFCEGNYLVFEDSYIRKYVSSIIDVECDNFESIEDF